MARSQTFDIDLPVIDGDGICSLVTPVAGGVQSLPIDGDLVVSGAGVYRAGEAAGLPGPYGVQISVSTIGDDSARTFTITGTDPDNRAISETIVSITSGSSKEGLLYYKTITSVTVDDDTAGGIIVGNVDEARTSTISLNFIASRGARSVINVTNTANFTLHSTTDDIAEHYKTAANGQAGLFVLAEEAAGAIDVATAVSAGVRGLYITVNSYTATAELAWNVTETYSG